MTDTLNSFPLLCIQNLAQPLNTQISAFADNTLSNFSWAENSL